MSIADLRKKLTQARKAENKAYKDWQNALTNNLPSADDLEDKWSDLGAASQGLADMLEDAKNGIDIDIIV